MDQTQSPPEISSKPISIHYKLTKLDLFTNHVTVVFRNKIIGVFYLAMLLLILGTTFNDLDFRSRPVLFKIIYLAFGFIFLGCIMLIGQCVLGGLLVLFQNDAGAAGEHSLEILDEGLVESTDVNRGLHKWAGIGKIISRRFYLYIYTGSNRFFQIPKRDFPNGLLNEFERELRRRLDLAKK